MLSKIGDIKGTMTSKGIFERNVLFKARLRQRNEQQTSSVPQSKRNVKVIHTQEIWKPCSEVCF